MDIRGLWGYNGIKGLWGYEATRLSDYKATRLRGYMQNSRLSACPGFDGMSGVRGHVRVTRECPGFDGMSGV